MFKITGSEPVKVRCQFSLRTLIVAAAGPTLIFAYVGTYYCLSRRGMQEAGDYGLAGFLYVPYMETATAQQIPSRHFWLTTFYAPLNRADRCWYKAEGPVDCIMWRLSGERRGAQLR